MIKNLAIGGSNRTMLLALVFGAICAVLVGVYLSGLNSDDSTGVSTSTVPVIVASQDIPAQTTITDAMLTVKEVPTDLVLTGSFTELTAVVGKRTQVQLVAGQQLLATNASDATDAVAQYGADAPLSLLIPEGKRGFAIYVSPVAAVGGLARAGDRVDVIVSETHTVSSDVGDVTTSSACYAMQDIPVLATGDTLRKPVADGDSSGVAAVDPNLEAVAMTLAVSNQEAIQLAAAQQSVSDASVGKQLWVALRSFGDHSPNTDLPSCAIGS